MDPHQTKDGQNKKINISYNIGQKRDQKLGPNIKIELNKNCSIYIG